MNIFAIVGDNIGACEFYRVLGPLRALEKHGGHQCKVFSQSDMVRSLTDGKYLFRGADLMIFQRLVEKKDSDGSIRNFPKLVGEMGISTVVDYDDDYTNAHRKVHEETFMADSLQNFSAITVSTPYLKRVMDDYHKKVHVLPNLILPEHLRGFKRHPAFTDRLVIGLTGSATHFHDWKITYEPIKAILRKHRREVALFVSGHMPDELSGEPNIITMRDLADSTAPEGDFFIPFKDYPLILRQIDIGLCPVDPADRFNWSKSNLKAIEMSGSEREIGHGQKGGAAVITTDINIYRDFVKPGVTGLMVEHNDAQAWYDAIESLIQDQALRHRLQVAGYERVMKYFNIHTRWREYESCFADIIDSDRRKRARRK